MKSLGKTIVLLMLIIIMALGGLLWFDYLGVMHVRTVFAPLYKVLGKNPQTSVTATSSAPIVADLDQDRIDKQLEAIEIHRQELERREEDIASKEKLNEQIANELASREKSQEDREKTFNQTVKQYDDKNVNIEQIATNLNGMTPQASVNILLAMDDQTVIDVLRKVEELAARNGTSSMGSYWLSLMPAERAAEIQRKMLSKPESLD
ncbi:MAG: flagellar protein FlbB [Treponema sp.]|nr:flagellar protein FlbB [Treponema sp.]